MEDPYKILGISVNAEAEEVKAAFQEKKKELQKQLVSKKPEEQKAAANQLQELVAAYGAIKKKMGASGGGSISPSMSKEQQKHAPVMGMEVEKKHSTEPSPLLQSYQLDESENEESSWQDMMKNGQAGKIAIAVLGAFVIGLGGYIAYDHFSKPAVSVPAPNTINDLNGKASKETLDITNKIKEELSHKPQVELRPKSKATDMVANDKEKESDDSSSTTKEDTASKNDSSDAAKAFRDFHAAITAKNYRKAYDYFSSTGKHVLGSWDSWAQGYKTTIASIPEGVTVVEQNDNETKLAYRLRAVDNVDGKRVTRYLKGTVTLIKTDDGWKINQIYGVWQE